MRRLLGSMAVVSWMGISLSGCGSDPPSSPPVVEPESSSYVAFEVYRSSLEITDAFFTYSQAVGFEEELVTVGRGGRGLHYTTQKYSTPLYLGTEADLLAAYFHTSDFILAGGVVEDGMAALRAYHDDEWNTVTHSASGNITGITEFLFCTDEGEIFEYTPITGAMPVFQAPEGVGFNAITRNYMQTPGIIAVGNNGAIFHSYDGGDFVDESIENGPDFVAIDLLDNSSISPLIVYAAGDDEIWQFFDGIWSLVYDFAASDLNDIAFRPDGTALAVGDNGLILDKDDFGWWDDFVAEDVDLNAIALVATGPDDFLTALCGSGGHVYRFGSGGWLDINQYATGPWSAIHVGGDDAVYAANGNTLHQFDGNDWVEFAAWEGGQTIESFHVMDATNVWAVGVDDIDHFVLFFDGADWSIRKQDSLDGFNAIWCDATGDSVFVAGGAGQIWRRQDESWLPEVDLGGTAAFHGLSGTAVDDLLAVGDSGLIMRRGPGGWAEEPSGTSKVLRAVDGSAICGDGGTVLRYSGDQWKTARLEIDARFNAVWCGGARDIWAVGDNATVVHFDGAEWTRLLTHLPGIDFLSVAGSTSPDVWIGGSEGYLLHNPGP